MCGIAGLLTHEADRVGNGKDLARRLGTSIFHRGPDNQGAHVADGTVAVNCRLAIVDVVGGEQPIYDETGTIGIVFNGEIYNYPALRDEMRAAKYHFKTHTDTEVILALYINCGTSAFARLEGMFAFCIWDDRTGERFICRDRFGMKPLYYSYRPGDRLSFASEIRSFNEFDDFDFRLSDSGIRDYITFRYINDDHTIYQNIKRLAPGCYLRWSAGQVTMHSFADLDAAAPNRLDYKSAKSDLRRLLRTSVESHLIGEAPIATLLSGGVDSSIIAVLLKDLGVQVEAFNVGFPTVNEFEYSTAVAKSCNLKLHNVEITPNELAAHADDIIRALDEPIADPACWPLFMLCTHIVPYAKVVLSGEGADELFGGYPQYIKTRDAASPRAFELFVRNSYYFLDNEAHLQRNSYPQAWRRFEKYYQGETELRRMMRFDFKTWLPQNLMMKADKILMSHSLEGRFPFLTSELFKFARYLPDDFKIDRQGKTKRILKEAFEDMLPEIILNRPKMGFSVPIAGLLHSLADLVHETLASAATAEEAGTLNLKAISERFNRFYAGDESDVLQLWTFFILLRWLFLARRDRAERARGPATIAAARERSVRAGSSTKQAA